ncbi:unnamed protein product [Caenorhabditis angaria]|uniref:DM domain-containing protein n=1 Tax=Caenorhabditis angaria TaxID=860376 RepID=A0A9P1IR80_9PELO|nr:unnamed protein product [Caenorhabditis angaria]
MADVMCAPFFQNIPHFITQQQQQQQQIVQKSTAHLEIQRPKEDQKKVYYCQRCLNHDRTEPRKNHKCECPFANCTCFKCSLVEKRRKLNLQLHELEGDAENLIGADGKKILDLEEEDRKLKGGSDCFFLGGP